MMRLKLCCLSLLATLLNACVKDNTSVIAGDDGETVELALSLDTYAMNADENALDPEKGLYSACVYIFNAGGVLENPGETFLQTADENGYNILDSSNKFKYSWNVTTGVKRIYVILNPTYWIDLNGTKIITSQFTPQNEEEVKSLKTDTFYFSSDYKPIDGTESSYTNSMLISGVLEATVPASDTQVILTVPVARRYARIDLSLRPGSTLIKNTGIKEIVLKNTRMTAHLITPLTESTGTDSSYSLSYETPIPVGMDGSPTLIIRYYTMPRIGAEKAACLHIEAQIGEKNYPFDIYINSGALNGNKENDENRPLDIVANKIYKVVATLNDPGIDVGVSVLDWKDQSIGGDIYGAAINVTNDQCLIYDGGTRVTGWNGDVYTIAEANYIYDGTVPSEVTNSITVEGTGMSLSSADKLTADKSPVKVLLGPTFSSGTVTLKFGNITKTVRVMLKDAFDAHFGSIVCDGQTTGADWSRNENSCFVRNEDNDKFVVCIPENVTPTGWIKYDHENGTSTPSDENDADAEPLFGQKRAEGIIRRSDLGATKVFIRQVAPVYLGHFGSPVTSGDLTAVDDGGYSKKRLIAEVIEENSSYWASANVQFYTRFSEFDEGLKIAEYLRNNNDAAAVKYCLLKNDRNGNGVLDPDEPIMWYLPALKELFGAWISYEPLRLSNDQFYSGDYWSSTESSAGRAHVVIFDSSGSSYYPVDYTFYVRCVRSL